MKKVKHSIFINGQSHEYSIKPIKKGLFWVDCPSAGIAQHFDYKDLGEFIIDLPQWIKEHETEEQERKSNQIIFRVNSKEKHEIEKRAQQEGFPNVSKFLRAKALKS